MIYRYLVFLFVPFLIISQVCAQNFTAFANKTQVGVGEVFQVSFRLEDGQGTNIEYPSFENFDVVGGPNSSQSMQIINGQVSQSFTYSFYLRGSQIGTFTIGSATITVKGKQLRTDPLKIEVVKSSSGSTGRSTVPDNTATDESNLSQDLMEQIRENVFVRAIPSKTSVYQGEQFSVTYKLYRRASLADLSLASSPVYKNFWVEDIEIGQPQSREEVYQGTNYSTAVIKKAILFPQRSGVLTVDPIELEAQVRVRVQNRRQRNVFEDFFDDPFFGSFRDIPYKFSSSSIPVTVKPLPVSGKPPSFDGVVGKYELSATLDKTETETGEPVTLKVVYKGAGNIKTIPEPQLDFPPDFEIYDPKTSDNTSLAGGFVSGSKTFEYLIVPRNPGDYKLPLVTFGYFDPSKGQYVTLNSEEYVLTVTGEPRQTTVNTTTLGKEDIELIGEDIRYIQTDDVTWQKTGKTFLQSWVFFFLLAAPFIIFALLLYKRRWDEHERKDVAGTRSRKATKVAKKRLAEAQSCLNKTDEKGFYREISNALWGYLGDKFNLGKSELSRDRIKDRLSDKNVPKDLINRVTDILDKSEMALFAPSSNGTSMKESFQTAEKLIMDLENHISR